MLPRSLNLKVDPVVKARPTTNIERCSCIHARGAENDVVIGSTYHQSQITDIKGARLQRWAGKVSEAKAAIFRRADHFLQQGGGLPQLHVEIASSSPKAVTLAGTRESGTWETGMQRGRHEVASALEYSYALEGKQHEVHLEIKGQGHTAAIKAQERWDRYHDTRHAVRPPST